MPVVSLQDRIFALGTGSPNDAVEGTHRTGPAGIEAIIEYNGLYLNVRDWVDTFLVTQISGIDDADVRDARDTNPGTHGETPGFAFYGGRTINLQGKIVARTLWKLRDMHQGLRAAFGDLSSELPLTFHGATLEQSLKILCRKSQKLEMAEQQTTPNHFERPFSVTLRASDPFFESVVERYASAQFGAASFDAIVFSQINNGNFPVAPHLELTGPQTNTTLINETNGQLFKLKTGTTIPGGEVWVFDGQRLYRKSDGASRWSYVDPTTTDFEYEPGQSNSIHMIASGLTGASLIQSWNTDKYI